MERLYVAQGNAGLLKVGRTSDFKQRLNALRQEFVQKGERLILAGACDPLECAFGAEHQLISALATQSERHSGREWFVGASFANALRAATEISARERIIEIECEKHAASARGRAEDARQQRAWDKQRLIAQKARDENEAGHAAYVVASVARKAAKQRRTYGPMDFVATCLLAERCQAEQSA